MRSGHFEPGNIDVHNLPSVPNPHGGISTIWSMGIADEEGNEILIPRVKYGRILGGPGDDEGDAARAEYERTGEHLGKFTTIEEANRFADWLHRQQELEGTLRSILSGDWKAAWR
jgi:hypothetical protein